MADAKITQLSANTTPLTTDIVPMVDDPAGTPATQKITIGNLVSATTFPAGAVVQVVGTNFSAVASGTTLLPYDDTIPQNTEGIEVMTQAITPKSTTNILVITAVVFLSSSIDQNMAAALFQDTTADALFVAGHRTSASTTTMDQISIQHTMVAGTTSATTFKIRAGGNGAGTTTFNGVAAGRFYGTAPKSSIVIWEYKA